MRRFLLALVLVAGCGAGGDQGGKSAEGKGTDLVKRAGLTGLYESEAAPRANQMCIIDQGGRASFGIVVWGANMHSCAGAGEAVKEGAVLRLTMKGDQACAIEARMEGDKVSLPAAIPAGCSYYCGAQAKLSGATFSFKGGSVEDAVKAKDLVGEPLCSASAHRQ
ncbi:MAG TPA: hypothetical protein VNT25_00385 [Allosphingosinicella sp.]|nr:hypothetical protein [Allosphingosinicella sp.]